MSQSGITLGPDLKLTVRDTDGIYLYNNIIQSFTYKWNSENRKALALGKIYPITKIEGVSGSFSVIRTDPTIEKYFVRKNIRYNSGITIPDMFIQGVLTNPDQSISTYNFNQCVISLDNAGEYTRDNEVIMQLSWEAVILEII